MKKQGKVKRFFLSSLPALAVLLGLAMLAETQNARLLRGLPILGCAVLYGLLTFPARCVQGKERRCFQVLTVLTAVILAVMTLDNIAGFLNGSTLTGGETDGIFWGGSFGLMGHAQVLSAFDPSLPAEGLKMAAEAAAHVPALWLLAVSFRRSGWLAGQNGK